MTSEPTNRTDVPPSDNIEANGRDHAKKNWFQSDRLVGASMLIAALVIFWQSLFLPPPVWDPLGMAFWPRVLASAMVVMGLVLVLRRRIDGEDPEPFEGIAFLVVAVGCFYVLAMKWFGFLLVTPIFVFASVVLLGWPPSKRRATEAAFMAVVGTAFLYTLFQKWLLVSLPEAW